MKGGHCCERIALQRMVKRVPETFPEALTRLGHDAAHRRHLTVRAGVPGRGGRHEPVDHTTKIEARGHQHGGARELVAAPEHHVPERAVRDEEPAPMHGRQRVVKSSHLVVAPERPLEPRGGERPAPEYFVTADRIGDLQPLEERVRIVVRHVEMREVHPHLEGVYGRVSHRSATSGKRERGGGRPRESRHHRRPEPQPVPDQRCGDADRHRAPRERSQGASTSQSGASITPAGFCATKGAAWQPSNSAPVTSNRLLLALSLVVPLLLVAAPAGATDPGAAGGAAAPVAAEPAVPAPPAEAAQTETTPTTPGGEEQPPDQTDTDEGTTTDGGGGLPGTGNQGGAGGESGGLPRTGIEIAGLAMIGLGLLMAGLALRPTSSWPPPRDRLSRSIPPR